MLVRCKNWANLLLLASVRNLHLFRSSNREANIEQEFISIDVMPQNAAFFDDGKCRKWMALVKISETWLKASEAPHKTKLNRGFGEETDKKTYQRWNWERNWFCCLVKIVRNGKDKLEEDLQKQVFAQNQREKILRMKNKSTARQNNFLSQLILVGFRESPVAWCVHSLLHSYRHFWKIDRSILLEIRIRNSLFFGFTSETCVVRCFSQCEELFPWGMLLP